MSSKFDAELTDLITSIREQAHSDGLKEGEATGRTSERQYVLQEVYDFLLALGFIPPSLHAPAAAARPVAAVDELAAQPKRTRRRRAVDLTKISVDELQLHEYEKRCLRGAGINNVSQLITWDDERLLKLKGFGPRALEDVKHALLMLGQQLHRSKPKK